MDKTSSQHNENAVPSPALIKETKAKSSDIATLTKEGVHNFTEIGKNLAGTLAQCNAHAIEAWKGTLWFLPPGSAMFLDIVSQELLACSKMQESVLHLIDMHTEIAANLGTELQQSVERDMAERTTFVADSFERGMDLVIDTQKGMLEIATLPLRSAPATIPFSAAKAA